MTQEKRKDWFTNLPKVPEGIPQIILPSTKNIDLGTANSQVNKDRLPSDASKSELNFPSSKLSMRNFLQKQRKPLVDPRQRAGPAHPAYLESKFSAKPKYGEHQRTISTRQLIPNTVVLQRDSSQKSRADSPKLRKPSHSRSELKSENNTRIILRSLDKYTQLSSTSTKSRREGSRCGS